MRRVFALLLIVPLFVAGCVQTTETTAESGGLVRGLAWYDSLILDYIADDENGRLQQLQVDSGVQIEWKFGGMVETDSINFMAFRLGHTSEGRFETDGWVYIDSNKRQLYGHDTGTDSISLWRQK